MPRKTTSKKSEKKFTAIPMLVETKKSKPAAAATPSIKSAPVATNTPVAIFTPAVTIPSAPTTKPSATAVMAAPVTTSAVTTSISSPAEDQWAAVAATIVSLRNSNADNARDAASELGQMNDRTAVLPLIEVLANTEGYFHSVVRAAAAASLGQLQDRRALEPLLVAITDPIAEVSIESIRALAALGDSEAIDALIDVVRNRTGYFLPVARRAAIVALGQLGGTRAQAELATVAENSFEEPAIRDAANTGLRR